MNRELNKTIPSELEKILNYAEFTYSDKDEKATLSRVVTILRADSERVNSKDKGSLINTVETFLKMTDRISKWRDN